MPTLPDLWLESPPGTLDLTVVRGRTFQRRIQLLVPDPVGTVTITVDGKAQKFSPVDLTGMTARAQVRSDAGELQLELGATVLPGTDGWVKLHATPAATTALPAPAASSTWWSRWDLWIDDGTDRCTPLRGRVRLLDDYAA